MEQRVTILAALLALALVVGPAAGIQAAYDDSHCTAPASWTNDPCAGRQWGLTNIETPEAWNVTRGAIITVAVVDTGVDFNHPDLAANLIAVPGSDITKNPDYRCPYETPPPNPQGPSSAIAQDDHGHGSHVAGIIAAVTGNGQGIAGVAPAAKVLPVKVLDAEGSGSDEDVARGICFAVQHGAKVINLSLGFDPVASIIVTGVGNQTDDAIHYAFSQGTAVIVAAGNETFPACDFPASLTETLCVGAVDERDVKAWYSNFGANLGVVAPGGAGTTGQVFCEDDTDVWSTIWSGSGLNCAHTGYDTLAGTSMATPHVTAVAALIAAKYGATATPGFIYAKLKNTADDLGAPGSDPVYGYGRVNARRAVTE